MTGGSYNNEGDINTQITCKAHDSWKNRNH